MGNKYRGLITVNDKYAMKFTTNAICELEDRSGMSLNEMVTAFEKGRLSMSDLRLFVWASLLHMYEDEDGNYDLKFTPKKAGDIIDEVGFDLITDKLTEALDAFFPDVDEQQLEKLKKKQELVEKGKEIQKMLKEERLAKEQEQEN
jgi:hypothetical protein